MVIGITHIYPQAKTIISLGKMNFTRIVQCLHQIWLDDITTNLQSLEIHLLTAFNLAS